MFTRIALSLIVILAVPYYWLLMDAGPTAVPPRDIDIARLRTLADSQSGPRPLGIEYAAVAAEQQPGTLLVAGGGLKSEEVAAFTWRLITPGGDTIINSGLTEDQAIASGYGDYHPEMQATVDRWLQTARRIIFTSEEIDHVGGFVSMLPEETAIGAKLVANPQQYEYIHALAPIAGEMLAPPVAALAGAAAYGAIAPGIAAVRTPGHLAGSQMIYVRLQNGREFLFAGDSAPMRRNVEWQRPRSRYAAQWRGHEDRAATLAWIKGLARLHEREPGLKLVYGHDFGWIKDPDDGPRFAPAPATALLAKQPATAP
ncbi:hypothetical protein [Novosphingobium sp. PASSN1]|uniref:hypothetical protein n=1 Tax=Novosphingobium sp. PASSN1 TaxID=2015561 RepID=UPI000BD143B1|nr:hypothetical protein [Novosphingobium sp. PASSN1]OYU37160.1 MAG: hypothetical protein CFE35_01950 [Novosphingobium sp. PASSN1]